MSLAQENIRSEEKETVDIKTSKKMKYMTHADIFKPLVTLVASSIFSMSLGAGEDTKDTPTDILENEHAIIEKMSAFAGKTAGDIRSGGAVDWEELGQLLDFFKNFADQCHHAKEETSLFPELRKLKVDPVVIDLLIKQHEEARILLDGMESILKDHVSPVSELNRQRLAQYLLLYAQLMERHVKLENEYLWPRVSQTLNETQRNKLKKEFQRIEEELGEGFHEKYHAIAMKLLKDS